MDIIRLGIVLSILIHGTSPILYWAATKTQMIQSSFMTFSHCTSHAGTFPDFDLNTREGQLLDRLRQDMDRLARCSIWTVLVCGPYNHIKFCYNLLMLLIRKPSLIGELALSPFKCSFRIICLFWPYYPHIKCENGELIPPPPNVYGFQPDIFPGDLPNMPPYGFPPVPHGFKPGYPNVPNIPEDYTNQQPPFPEFYPGQKDPKNNPPSYNSPMFDMEQEDPNMFPDMRKTTTPRPLLDFQKEFNISFGRK